MGASAARIRLRPARLRRGRSSGGDPPFNPRRPAGLGNPQPSGPGSTKREVKLQNYAKFQEDGGNGRLALRDMMRGVSTRDYSQGVEGFLRGYGTARSSVSRGFIRASEAKLKELMERDLSKLDLAALFMDGVGFQGQLQVVAMGGKHALGLWQGATENQVVCQALLDDLIRRGLDPEKRYLFVIDGGKGLRAAIQRTFGKRGEVQRCQ